MTHTELTEKYALTDVCRENTGGRDHKSGDDIPDDVRYAWQRFIERQIALDEEEVRRLRADFRERLRTL